MSQIEVWLYLAGPLLFCAHFADLIVAIVLLLLKEVTHMFKNLWMIMDYGTYFKWQLLGIVSGIALGWCACDLWENSYRDAKEGGAVA